MYGKVISSCVNGMNGRLVEVEIDLSNGLPQMNIVGLPDNSIRESTDRVRSAIKNCNFSFPMERITVNLAPADLRKEGSAFDLAIAVGILQTSGQIHLDDLERTLFIGELSLDGGLRPIPGVLPMVHGARNEGLVKVMLPVQNAEEAALVEGIEVIPVSHLQDLSSGKLNDPPTKLFNEANHLLHKTKKAEKGIPAIQEEDFNDVLGQYQAKRALMIAAAGMHNIMLIGPPGSGKTMLIRRLPSILPPLDDDEAMDVTKIYSIAGKLTDRSTFIRNRPFRAPHHTISQAGLIGGGSPPLPGEVSLAHKGVLFLDELPEFARSVLEVLRQPLEDRRVAISRARGMFVFPTDFMLAATMNPCPCGYYGSESETTPCTCSPHKISAYRAKISGPLLDRIDLHVDVPRVDYRELSRQPISSRTTSEIPALGSSQIRQQILAAREVQYWRYAGEAIHTNGGLNGKLLRKHCRLKPDAEQLLFQSFQALGMSVRAHDRILKIARTIADLEGSEQIDDRHLAEAIQYRNLDRKYTMS
ncbi:YifB family Mg chelatase-like AAA ATPase [Ferviditalea candida]|uniref:YifB family Mg chelatase-like AAA ATPase n=1 Tax=Ferviditalea candida TaxID=3108399 RepID=A0ABU5ZIN4_9BACL|nr:YifB family Mg chelatase-like AAA ATPase [Paenibacillaceae bacterium T2]